MKNLICKDLTYKINGICFRVHKELGRFCRERQYCDEIEKLLRENKIFYRREYDLQKTNLESPKGNKVDFIIENKIIIDIRTCFAEPCFQ